jgi:hypothetical protein
MPLSTQLLDQLAAQLAPGIDLLLTPSAIAGLAWTPVRGDIAGLRAWFGSLDDRDLRLVLERLPKHELVAAALRTLGPASVAGRGLVPGAAPHITGRFVPIVDRHEVWNEILSLQVSSKRILLLKGDPRSGKSHLRWLVQEYCDQNQHVLLYVDLEDTQTVERAVTLGLNPQLATPIQVESKLSVNNADLAWARAIARTVFNRVRAEYRGQTPWLVFDHFDRMPMAGQGEAGAFFNTLIDLVAKQASLGPEAANAMRLVLIDIREVPGDARSRTIIRSIQRVSSDDIARFVRTCRPALSDDEAQLKAQCIVAALREPTYMDDLGENVVGFVEAP